MNKYVLIVSCSIVFVLAGTANAQPTSATARAQSEWVHPGPDGRLAYKQTPRGDKLLDFSFAGYMGGGVALPAVPVKRMVPPAAGADNTAAIQAAINDVAAMPVVNGFRGAVVLAPGIYSCSATITIPASGIVLRGSGTSSTTIRMSGGKHCAIVIGSPKDARPAPASAPADGAVSTSIVDRYVPYGATVFTVADAGGLRAGDLIEIKRPVTQAWIHQMEMDNMRRDGKQQTWIPTTRSSLMQRTITAIAGNTITIDIPFSDSFDAAYLNPPGTIVAKVQPAVHITQAGVESLHIQCPPAEMAYSEAPYSAIDIYGDDCWVKDVSCEETMNSTTLAGRRITVQQVVVSHTFPNLGGSKPSDFSIEGSQILVDRCRVTGDNEYDVWTGSLVTGPNVVLNSTFLGLGSRLQPHQRWSTGLLIDNCTVPNGGIDYMNRGIAGSGHGWTMGWGVVWNSVAKTYIIQNPPGVLNWAIGCTGRREQTARLFDTHPILSEGVFESHGTPVAMQSLYLAQLADRLGPEAARTIGYASNSETSFPNKSIPLLPDVRPVADEGRGADLAFHRPVDTKNAPRIVGSPFSAEKIVDGIDSTYWSANTDSLPAVLDIDMEGPVEISSLEIREPVNAGSHIENYTIEGQADADYIMLSHGTTIGECTKARFSAVTVWKVRLTILKAKTRAAICKVGLYRDGK